MVHQPAEAAREPAPAAAMRSGTAPLSALRSWRGIAGLTGLAAGAVIVTGAFLPWVTTFAGLIGIPGVRGGYGRILAVAGTVIALAGLAHALRGDRWSRWVIGIAGFLATGFAGFLLLQLAAGLRSLSSDSMVAARSGPGLWVTAAGSALAFATMFLPASAQRALVRPEARGTALGWAADLESAGLRRGIQIALGLLWLADGALQLQPSMFGRGFVTHILMPAYLGSPAGVTGPAMAFTRLVLHAPAAWNTAFAVTQLLLGAALLWRRTARAALAASIAWALGVWWFGEGLGGVLDGAASPLTGAPGAAILYALLAVAAWPVPATPGQATRGQAMPGQAGASGPVPPEAPPVVAGSPLGLTAARIAWLALWGSFGYFILQAPVRAPGALRDTLAGLASGEPGWLAGLDRALAAAAGSHGTVISVILAAGFVMTGLGIFWSATTRAALLLSVAAAVAIWVAGENFGGIATGHGTDPSSGPLLVLLAAAFWPLGRRPAAAMPGPRTAAPVVAERETA